MKQIIKFTFMVFAVALAMTACAPQEFDDYALGGTYTINSDQVSFDMTPGSDAWTFKYTAAVNVDAVKYPYTYEIRFGDGVTTKTLTGSHEYIVVKGTYTAQILVYTPNGEVVIKEKVITLAEDNEKIYQDDQSSLQFALTGGKENVAGKEWFIGEWTAMRNPGNRNEVWWPFANEAVMNDVLTFIPNSIKPNGKFIYDNKGDTHMNEALGTLFPDGDPAGSFVTVNYIPPKDATWDITERNGKKILTIYKGFITYPASPDELNKSEYEVLEFSPARIRLVNVSTWDGWCYELVSEVAADPLVGDGERTWVIDQNNKHADEVKAATGLDIKGFMGLGPLNSYNQVWWGAGPGDKSYDNTLSSVKHGWTLFDWKITFSASQMKIVTAGEGYGRAKLDGTGGFASIWRNDDDMAFNYTGGNFTYTKAKGDPYQKLTLSGNAFFGYYVGTQEYEILYLSDNALCVAAHNTAENQDWVFIFCPEGEQ